MTKTSKLSSEKLDDSPKIITRSPHLSRPNPLDSTSSSDLTTQGFLAYKSSLFTKYSLQVLET